MMQNKRIAFVGDGSWGTTLACLVVGNGHSATLWGAFPEITEEILRTRRNAKFLPGVTIPDAVHPTNDPAEAVRGAEFVIFSTPVVYLRSVAEKFADVLRREKALRLVLVAKGIERGTLLRGSEVLKQVLGVPDVAMLCGPSHAEEVAKGQPTTIVAADSDMSVAEEIQRTFMNDRFRVYTSTDPAGVEIAAAVKNVIAIAAGICDGLGFGDNAKAALLTRGLAEITRLALAMGAQAETLAGLSGIGDLITTCISPHGRNLRVGRQIGAGKTLDQVLKDMSPMVPEGVFTVQAACELARRHGIEMPISEAVREVLFENKPPALAAHDLMTRDAKPEHP
jgi:glycerol-3-phosphate dehydrogenase (NAD(P)+)